MKSFWIFRTNLRQLEYYHSIKDLQTFEKNCHDFYLLQIIWFLRKGIFDEGIVWRIGPKRRIVPDIVFDIDGRKFIQKFVRNLSECFNSASPTVSFFRDGFPEYDSLTGLNSDFFGLKLYLAAGKRTFPSHGKYSRVLVESDLDLRKKVFPFYKTANPEIFKPLNLEKKYDICWICNYEQIKFKGQKFFMDQISKTKFLRRLNICHIGNRPEVGKSLCKQFSIHNINFLGHLERSQVNNVLNESKFGLVTSNHLDGCPRVITEIMMSGTPLLLRSQTKLLDYYKKFGVVVFNDDEVERKFDGAFRNFDFLKSDTDKNINDLISMETVCEKNLKLWL